MLILVDKKIPSEALKRLSAFGEVIGIQTTGITYEAISGHPDIFFNTGTQPLIVAPNLPVEYKHLLQRFKVPYQEGTLEIGGFYPESARYCAAICNRFVVHNLHITDPVLLRTASVKEPIMVKQGYTRCNLIFLDDNHAITSDIGIMRQLQKKNIEVFYFHPHGIILPGIKHGFIGGTCGVINKRVYFLGNPLIHSQGKALEQFINSVGYEIFSLYNGPLFDGGGILFISQSVNII